jgi:hypothetical protein
MVDFVDLRAPLPKCYGHPPASVLPLPEHRQKQKSRDS